jgi:hypothetical protein
MNKYKELERISENINILFKRLFLMENHPFYNDLNKVNELHNEFKKSMEKKLKYEINYDPSITIPNEFNISDKKYQFTKTDINLDILKDLSIEINRSNNFNKIKELVNTLYFMNIPSNVENVDKLLKICNKSKYVNVAIIGAGPIGLFLACYIYKYYNLSYGLHNNTKVNIIIFDNRIEKKGVKKPYTRYRPFVFNSSFFSYLLPRIYTWINNNDNSLMINIYIIEYVLFTLAYYVYNIPFIFEENSWDEYCKYMKNGKIDIMFDCTGSRLNPPIFNNSKTKNIDTSWLDIFKNRITKFPKLNIDVEKNLVTLDIPKIDKKTFLKNYYYANLIILDKYDGKLIFRLKIDIDVNNYSDLKLFINLKNKYFIRKDVITICKKIKDNYVRNFVYNSILKYTSVENNQESLIYNFEIFNTYLRHSISISKVVTYDDHNFLYIGAGDTIFHSHFIVGAGLNRTISFAVKCANFITNISLVDE